MRILCSGLITKRFGRAVSRASGVRRYLKYAKDSMAGVMMKR